MLCQRSRGCRLSASRYAKTKVRGRTVSLHRFLWEQAYGPIPVGHIVHHIDGDKRNNDLANLQLMTHREHAAHHNTKHPLSKPCQVCGAVFTPAPTKRERQKACGPACARALISLAAQEREARRRAPVHDTPVVSPLTVVRACT